MGLLFNWNLLFILLFICTFASGVFSSNTNHHKSCLDVQNEFVNLEIGSKDLVPDIAQHVAHLAVCGRGRRHPGERLCCTNSTVNKYHGAAKKYLKDSLHSGTVFLKKYLRDKLKQYEERTQLFLNEAKNRTSVLLTQMHNIPWTKHHEAVKEFFHHLEKYIFGDNDNLHNSVKTFFSKLFPSVFYYTLNDPSFIQMDDKYHECLSKHAENIQPFGKVPHYLQKKLQHSLRYSRSFVSLLTDIVEVMETTDKLNIDNDCMNAVTRLQYCSRCHGHTLVKPCRGFCLNVMRGCLAKLSDVSPAWDSLVSSFKNLVSKMKGKSSLKNVLMSIDKSVFDGILEAMQGGPKIHKQVLKDCVHTTKTKTDKHPYERKLDTTLMMAQARDLSNYSLEEVVESVSKRLEDSLGMYNRIADGICRNQLLYADKMISGTCWNGTDIGQYLTEVPEANIFSQAKSNREVKVTVTDQHSLSTVKSKLTDMRTDMTRMLSDDVMLGDEPPKEYNEIVYSSGDKRNTFVITDDEDFGPSGSGSGDDVNTPTVTPKETDLGKDEKPDKKPSGASTQSLSILLSTVIYLYWFH